MTDQSATSKPRALESPPRDRREILQRWMLATGCFLVLLFFFSPPWGAFVAWSRAEEMGFMIAVRRGVNVLTQVEHPGTEIPDPLHGAIQWRLLFPVIGHVLSLPPPVLFALAHAGCVGVLAFIVTVLRRRGVSFANAAMTSLILGAGSWFFASVAWLGYFDSWLVLALLIVGFSKRSWTMWLACAWAPWIDERFVIAAPLALLCRFLTQADERIDAKQALAWCRRELTIPATLIAVFLGIRLGILTHQSGSNATISGYMRWLDFRETPFSQFLFGIWEGLRAGWVFVVAAIWLLWPQRRHAIALGAMVLAVMLVSLLTAQDFSRSMMFVIPAALLGAVRVFESAPRWLSWTLRGTSVAALLLPGNLVMSNGVSRVFYLYHELDTMDHPPAAMSADFYELSGIRVMQDGKFSEAESYLTLAIKLAENPTAACKQRGVLRANQQRWKDAREDFALMVHYEPTNPDGWFLRAQANLALGDAGAARSDMQQAVAVAPRDWPTRPDVARFLAKLNQAH